MHRKPNRRGQWAAIFAILASALGVIGFGGAFAAAHAVTTTVTATTAISNRPDSGHGGIWASDTISRTVTVTVAPVQTAPAGSTNYDVTITDKGSFTTLAALAPNQSTAGVHVAAGATGTLTGTYALAVVAPTSDTLTGTVPATEDDQNSTTSKQFVSTTDWPKQVFADQTKVTVTGGAYSWTYTDGKNCQQWVDSSANGDGNLAADGNITGVDSCNTKVTAIPDQTVQVGTSYNYQVAASTNSTDTALTYSATGLPDGLVIDKSTGVISGVPLTDAVSGAAAVKVVDFAGVGPTVPVNFTVKPAAAPLPYVYAGHDITVNNNRATVGWSDSATGWPSKNECVEVWISGYGFGAWDPQNPTSPGTSHVGFTCNNGDQTANVGYLRGLAAGHNYALRIVPAVGVYGNNHPIPGANVGYVDVLTTR